VPALRAPARGGLRARRGSNWDVSLHEQLERTGLTPLLDGALSSAEVGAPKPDPEIFARALALAGASPEEALHVGDDVEADVGGALAAGLRAGADRPRRLARAAAGRAPDRLAGRAAGALCLECATEMSLHTAPGGARRHRAGADAGREAEGDLAPVPLWAPLAALLVAFFAAAVSGW
jgi:phosphoglycolate phosphatase-like HAD superfamily hydrolase